MKPYMLSLLAAGALVVIQPAMADSADEMMIEVPLPLDAAIMPTNQTSTTSCIGLRIDTSIPTPVPSVIDGARYPFELSSSTFQFSDTLPFGYWPSCGSAACARYRGHLPTPYPFDTVLPCHMVPDTL